MEPSDVKFNEDFKKDMRDRILKGAEYINSKFGEPRAYTETEWKMQPYVAEYLLRKIFED